MPSHRKGGRIKGAINFKPISLRYNVDASILLHNLLIDTLDNTSGYTTLLTTHFYAIVMP